MFCSVLSKLSFQEASIFEFCGAHCPQWLWNPRKENLSPFTPFLHNLLWNERTRWQDAIFLNQGMAIHSSILAWRTWWTEEPGGLQLVGSYRVVHNWVMNTFRTLTSCQRVEWEPFWSSQSLPYQNFSVLNFLPYVSNRGKNFEISVCFQCTIYIFLSSMSPLKWTRFLDFLTFHLIFCFFSPSTILHIAITAVFQDNSYTITLLQI